MPNNKNQDIEEKTDIDDTNGDESKSADNFDKEEDSTKELTSQQLIKSMFDAFGESGTEELKEIAKENVSNYLKQIIRKNNLASKYNILILYDEGQMIESDADHIYSSVTKFENKKPILLILHSFGGQIGPAYLIGKLCQEYAKQKFIIVVPRRAKSAATLLCCAADEIHMGSLSEIGPIDPQIDGLPALGLKSSIEHIADLVKDYPQASDMFAKYLNYSVKPIHLGYFERVAESACQYAERLLRKRENKLRREAHKIAFDLVYSYKDHSFVIDKSEAREIFGENIVKINSDEYKFGNEIYRTLLFISNIASILNQYFYFIGSCDSKPNFRKN